MKLSQIFDFWSGRQALTLEKDGDPLTYLFTQLNNAWISTKSFSGKTQAMYGKLVSV